jgi:hypothetical protein
MMDIHLKSLEEARTLTLSRLDRVAIATPEDPDFEGVRESLELVRDRLKFDLRRVIAKYREKLGLPEEDWPEPTVG